MSPFMILFMTWALVAGMLAAGQTAATGDPPAGGSDPEPPIAAKSSSTAPVWTNWGADQYALADDGVFLWIGATGGVVRWDKQQGTHRRYSAVDGLPQTVVLAVAVDGDGNRWFGGDGGLSRLDAEENWTHFRAADGGLYSNLVDGIAVVGGDTLYLSHGLPGGRVSRRDADGSWRWFPNRETAIQADYAAIIQAHSTNPLWAVSGTEVWAGWWVFDGERWHERMPYADAPEPGTLAVDSRNHVWALGEDAWTFYDGDYNKVYEWDGQGWLAHGVGINFTGRVTALAVDSDDRVWVGLQQRDVIPYSSETAYVRDLSGTADNSLGVSGPVAALLPTAEGLWAVGPGWLMTPDFTAAVLIDGPRFRNLPDALVGATAQSGSTAAYGSRMRWAPCRPSTTGVRSRWRMTLGRFYRTVTPPTRTRSSPHSSAQPAIPGTHTALPVEPTVALKPCVITGGRRSNTRSPEK